VEREASGDVQEAVAQAFGFGLGEFVGQQQLLGPNDQVVREAHDLEPHLVVFKGAERQVAQPGFFVVADVVLDARAAAVITLKAGDIAGLVCEDRLEAMPVVVGERELRAGVRALASEDHPRARRPAAQVEVLGDLAHLAVVARVAVLVK